MVASDDDRDTLDTLDRLHADMQGCKQRNLVLLAFHACCMISSIDVEVVADGRACEDAAGHPGLARLLVRLGTYALVPLVAIFPDL